jgi:hypothetical protein
MLPKAIHDEMGGTFDDYGRMSAKLGLEVLNSNVALSTFSMQTFVDPPTEFVNPGKIQIWKITHNGVDTHPIHFHLFDVQLINRVGWDGFIRLPDANELGWKDTVRISPLEDTIVALRPIIPQVPFVLPESIRPLNPTQPLGSTMGFGQLDPLTGGALEPLQTNVMANFGFEYTWHCHILSHEENDMMRVTVFKVKDHIGVLNNGQWYLDGSGNGAWEGAPVDKLIAGFTPPVVGGIPVAGDWNANGIAKIGIYDPAAFVWYLDMDGNGVWDGTPIDAQYFFGYAGAIPVVGNWGGKGSTRIGIYDPSALTWNLDMNGNGTWDGSTIDKYGYFGLAGGTPVVGDWNGDGSTEIGMYLDNAWYMDVNGNGYWDGEPTDKYGFFGLPGGIPVTGDWSGDGKSKIGMLVGGTTWYLDVNNNGYWDGAPTDMLANFGTTGSAPAIGKW